MSGSQRCSLRGTEDNIRSPQPQLKGNPMLKLSTRRHLIGAAIAVGAFAALPAAAQDGYPSKTIRIVNAFPPGGPADIISRAVAEKMTTALKQRVIVDNKPGAGGNIGAAEVARAAADGYTLFTGIDTTFTVNPYIYKSLPFKPTALKPLMIMASSGLLVGAYPPVGVKTLGELVTMAKSKPVMFSSGSNGSPGHLATAILSDTTGAQITHVPYKGNSPAVLAVLSGEVQAGILATPGMAPHVQAGKITPLAVTSRQRSLLLPDVPTTAEAGLKALDVEILYVMMAPAATPEPVMATLRKAFADALAEPDVQKHLEQLDLHDEGIVGDEAAQRLADVSKRYEAIIKKTGMKIE